MCLRSVVAPSGTYGAGSCGERAAMPMVPLSGASGAARIQPRPMEHGSDAHDMMFVMRDRICCRPAKCCCGSAVTSAGAMPGCCFGLARCRLPDDDLQRLEMRADRTKAPPAVAITRDLGAFGRALAPPVHLVAGQLASCGIEPRLPRFS